MLYTPKDYPIESFIMSLELVKRPRGVRKRKNEREILNAVTAFDIETTTVHIPDVDRKHDEHSFMYVWQWALGSDVVIGRTWGDFTEFCQRIAATNKEYGNIHGLSDTPLLVVYVHNLAFEWQFLAGIYAFRADETFFAKERKPIYCRMFDALEMRCSYKQTNMSLERFAEKMGASVQKENGAAFNYHKQRYPWTVLDDNEIRYIIGDVLSLKESMEIQLERDGDTLLSIPLTSTGYVRRDCKRALSKMRNYVIKPMLPNVEQYKLLRAAFRGGNTHANVSYVGRIIENVESVDMASCYPAQQLTKPFPMKPFQMLKNADMQRVLKFIALGYAVVAEWTFTKLEVKDVGKPCPYISLAKTKSRGFETDNGRLLYADVSIMTLTEVDLQIILDTYSFETIDVGRAMVAQKAPLPIEYRQVILDYYTYKTSMKAAAKTSADIEYQYMKSKNKLNSVYGMSAQDPIHQRIIFENGDFIQSDYDDVEAVNDLGRAPFPYQWGVYTTAYARAALQEGIIRAGNRLVYVDTDSVKTDGHVDFSDINVSRETMAKKHGAVANDEKGIQHAVGVFEVDGLYRRFITQGAKRYAYEDMEGCMHVTVSGVTQKVNPDTNVPYCVEELRDLQNFAPGMVWDKAGGTTAVYNDDDDFIHETSEGVVHITRNVSIVETTYHMTHAKDYIELLRNVALYGRWKRENE